MSISWSAGLIYGVVLKPFRKKTQVTKYNPDTGVPYQKTVDSIVYRISGAENEPGCEITEDQLPYELYDTNNMFGGAYDDARMVGIRVAGVHDDPASAAAIIPILMMDTLRNQYHKLITDNFETEVANRILRHSGLTLFIYP